jgi:hypothetical protein
MTFHDDPDLERRLRRIADDPQPPVPESVYRYAGEVARHRAGSRMHFSFRLGRGLSPLASAVGVIGAIVVAVLIAGLLLSARTDNAGRPSQSPTPTASLPPSYAPTPTPRPTPTTLPSATTMTTPGALSGWTGFSWKSGQKATDNWAGRVVAWRGGYVAANSGANPASSLWTSSDGETWTPVSSIPGPWFYVSAAPDGLVVLAIDYGARSAPDAAFPTSAPYSATVWTSSDGVNWRDAGTPDFGGLLISIAGTDSGLVATVMVSQGAGDQAASSAGVEFSTDGVHWTPETIESGLAWSNGPTVQSNGGRFFLMGGTTTGLARAAGMPRVVFASSATYSYVWWSDDGRTWIRSGGTISGFGQSIDFGRDGMLLNIDFGTTPGGVGMALSNDGGETWQPYDTFGPLGVAPCSGECSVQPDGVLGSNGTVFVAVKNGGKKAWLSYDGHTWSPIAWAGGDPSSASYNGFGGFTVLPRGVLLTGVYGAAK